ncbi:MAG: DUF4115 domain-containing protein [Cyanobacteria bacterium]|nr:DUF4115 domain-containing protein [Cyanobacteriota bacterium]
MSDGTLQHEGLRAERLAEIGDRLRQRREALGLSLDAVCARTKIQRRLLQALETANVAILPEPVYVRGFIRQYADALELDGTELSMAYPLENVGPSRASWGAIVPAPRVRPLHLYGLYIVLLVLSVVGLSVLIQRSNSWGPAARSPVPTAAVPTPPESPTPPTPAPTVSPSPAAIATPTPSPSPTPEASPEPSPEASPTPTPSPEASPSPSASPTAASSPAASPTPAVAASPAPASPAPTANSNSNSNNAAARPAGSVAVARAVTPLLTFPTRAAFDPQGIRVEMVARDQSWVRVVVDGKVEFEGVLKAGMEQGWSAKESLVVRSGNAGGIVLSHNGAEPKPMGEPGTIQEQEFRAAIAN